MVINLNEALLKQIDSILKCPSTGNKIIFDEIQKEMTVKNTNIRYAITDGIIDFLPKKDEQHIDSYAKRAKRYEKAFEKPNILIKLLDKIIWGIKHEDYAPKVVNFIPKDFQGILLDIPVGTGILTLEKYKKLPKATILVMDYSIDMLNFAKKRYTDHNLRNIIYIHADVGNLPFQEQTIDTLITMNGYHAFPDKDKALEEIRRVIKLNGQFLGCFYIRGKRKRTDTFVKRYYTKKGWFIPPYYTSNEIINKFKQYFEFKTANNCKSMFYFDSQRLI